MINLVLLGLLILFSILAIELKNLTYSIVSLGGFGVVLGIIFYQFNAPYVSVFQILIYGGAITVLLFSLVNLTKESPKNK